MRRTTRSRQFLAHEANPRNTTRRVRSVLTVSLTLLSSGLFLAQSPPSGQPQFRATTDLIRLDVSVLDPGGLDGLRFHIEARQRVVVLDDDNTRTCGPDTTARCCGRSPTAPAAGRS
jgi:hypothetical protein